MIEPMADVGTILVVDDDRRVASVMTQYLEGQGHAVTAAHSGGEARTALAAHPVDVLFLDLRLPDADGIQIVRETQRLTPTPDVVIVTGHATLDSAIAAVELGAAGYIEKPIDLHRLGALVTRSLERRRLLRENAALLAQVTDRRRQADALRAISATVLSTLDFREALQRICDEFTRLLGADTAAVYLHDPASDALVPKDPSDSRPLGVDLALWRDRRPVHSDDVGHDERFSHEAFRRVPHQSGLMVPLVLEAEVAGAFYLVWWTARRRITDDEMQLVEDLAGHVALFLRNARLHEKIERERHRLEALNEVSRRLAAVHRVDDVLLLIVNEASRLLGAEASGLRLREGDDLVVGARTESAAPLMARARLKLGESLSGIVVATGEAVAVEDLAADTRYDAAHREGALRLGFRGFIGVPLRARGHVVGTLNVYTRGVRRFESDEVSLLSAFADQAALAIEKAGLLRAADEQRRVLADLSRVALAMQASWEREPRLAAFVGGAHDVLGFDRTNVFLPTADGRGVELVATEAGPGLDAAVVLPLSPRSGAYYQAWQERRAVAVLDDEALARVTPLDSSTTDPGYFRSRRFIVAPLVVGDRVVGVAGVDNKPSGRPIDPASVEPFFLLCQQLAAALEESRLYGETQAREREAAQFYTVTRELASSLEADRVLEVIVDKTVELLGGDAAGVYLYDESRGGLVFRRGLNLPDELTQRLVLKPGEGVAGRAFSERRPVWTTDRLADPTIRYSAASAALVATRGARGYLAVPIGIRGEILGVLVSYSFAPREFTAKEVQILSSLADHAGIAVDNARHFTETETQRRRFAQIFASTSDGIVLVGRDGRIQAANRRAGELLGFDAARVVGLGLAELLADPRAVAREPKGSLGGLSAVLEDPDRESEGDLDLPRLASTVHWVARPTADAVGATIGLTLTLQDVTQEREVSRMKSDFVSFVTHQLRTPLAGIRWMLELAAEGSLTEDVASYIHDASGATARLIGLVNDLLDIARLESGRLTTESCPLDLEALTQSVLGDVAAIVGERGHRIAVSAEAELPQVPGDPQLLRQVVLNLVSNAIKYTPPGGDITIHLAHESDGLRWRIRDTGIGIPRESQRRLFEKFYRAENAQTLETEGTGLGLYLVKLIVERHGGHIWCESEEGRGSTFAFTVPT